ncbi:brain acid soluble protein 1-like [Peromyscus californicus insignis]|uniref:brain acid soluble protein 1-like n=1 Tax=Peromyscus californicus insignis TaxID=564181 RepID=UPI0022A699EA|nr:brain acid soluble protein 1-like [Peromyscus californicus insignis]
MHKESDFAPSRAWACGRRKVSGPPCVRSACRSFSGFRIVSLRCSRAGLTQSVLRKRPNVRGFFPVEPEAENRKPQTAGPGVARVGGQACAARTRDHLKSEPRPRARSGGADWCRGNGWNGLLKRKTCCCFSRRRLEADAEREPGPRNAPPAPRAQLARAAPSRVRGDPRSAEAGTAASEPPAARLPARPRAARDARELARRLADEPEPRSRASPAACAPAPAPASPAAGPAPAMRSGAACLPSR